MYLDVDYKDNKVMIKDIKNFEPQHIFECGQCFRWDKEEDGSFTGIAYNKVVNVKKIGADVVFRNTAKEDFINIWTKYFDLGTDYSHIKDRISQNDKVMQQAVAFGRGIRILKQEPWETLISFIISSNNNIPRIKRSIELLAEGYGEYLGEFYGKKRYGFPSAEILSNLSIEELKACNTGYRASYIKNTASMVVEAPTALEELKGLEIEACQQKLLGYQGVGPKVAHCILFFCMEKMEAFPVDIWVKRVMEHLYFHKEIPPKVIQQFASEKFGEYAGFAQQYLFYYARESAIGKK
ncbi:N-glycosylase/DNA lyase [Anaerovirgula multivorans]|uniref:DNA-(apurinic or apyrimidinic site) lyase n=1 Tax=Anaerovirgula multivorans TaxID=312168 RepID=A0A239HUM5_9FIRM|nr:DNA glycosylase [Anaerovirgula multivorans]SNS83884.1 N-glycosylase/DNA lyase [Anaerovirgula multivorans]